MDGSPVACISTLWSCSAVGLRTGGGSSTWQALSGEFPAQPANPRQQTATTAYRMVHPLSLFQIEQRPRRAAGVAPCAAGPPFPGPAGERHKAFTSPANSGGALLQYFDRRQHLALDEPEAGAT